MAITLLLLAAALLITASHGAMLLSAQKRQYAPVEERIVLWRKHVVIHGILWILLALAVGGAQFSLPKDDVPIWLRAVGFASIMIGITVFLLARRELGIARAMGYRFFFPEKAGGWLEHGIYRTLANPMYDGFILILAGLGATFGIREDIVLAAGSFLLLNVCLARVESRAYVWRAL